MMQYRVDSMLQFGIICSIVWMMGLGSLYAFVCGLRAKSIIKASGGELVGTKRANWCIIVGGIGMAAWLPILIAIVIRNYS
jgi:hypothetical protein